MLYFACGLGTYYAGQVGGHPRYPVRTSEPASADNPAMAPEDDTIAGLLQSLEHTLETVTRLTTVAEQLIAGQRGGPPLSSHVLQEYSRQLITVRRDSDRLRDALGRWWAQIGESQAH
jgi:hypothetical protein